MTPKEQLEAFAYGIDTEARYAPVDRLKALAMLLALEERQGNPDVAQSFYLALEAAASAVSEE